MHIYIKELIRTTKELLKNVQVLKEDPALDIEKKFELKHLSAALKKLPAVDKHLIAYRYFENKSYPEIAKLSFMDITTVRRKLDNIILEKYLLKDICAKTFNSFYRPDKESEVFIITGWKIKSQSTIKIYMPEP